MDNSSFLKTKLNAPLYNAVKEYAEKDPARFHMPSHKGECVDSLYLSAPFDVTELDFSDDLMKASGVILDAENLLAKTYNVDNALMHTNGATSGLFSALYAVKRRTSKIILSKNSHKSIYNAISVLGLEPVFCEVEFDEYGLPLPISADVVGRAILDNPDAGAVLVTTPDYFGRICDLLAIREVSEGRILVADGAHGGHFVYTNMLENRAEKFADITVLGVHKTLNCYTGSCVVLCKNEFYRILKEGRELFHSTSPQYLSMCSIDYARAFFEQNGKRLYKEIFDKLVSLELNTVQNYDFCKVLLKGGEKLSNYLKCNGVYPECVYGDFVLLIVSPFDVDRLDRVKELVLSYNVVGEGTDVVSEYPSCEYACKFNDCFDKDTEMVDLRHAVGRILAKEIGLYPPGVPAFIRGQRLSREAVEFLLNYEKSLFGVDSGCVCVLK